jgi:hypothetical protein
MLAFMAILTTSICGLAGAPLWTAAVCALALATISYARHQALFERAADHGMQDAIDQTLLSSLANGFAAGVIAYGCGAALRLLS